MKEIKHPTYSIDDRIKASQFTNVAILQKRVQSLQNEIIELRQKLSEAKQIIAFYEHCDEVDWTASNNQELEEE